MDNTARRLYLAQEGVTVLDLESRKVIPHFVAGASFPGLVPTHDVLPVNDGKALAVTVVDTNSVDFFNARTGEIFAKVSVGPLPKNNWHNPDQILYDPKSKFLIAVNGDSSSMSLIDTRVFAKKGDIPIGKGKLEAAAADGAGLVYVNEAEKNAIAVIDIAKRQILREYPLKNCEEPTGLAYDSKDRLVISVCSNGLLKFVDSDSGNEAASIKVGPGADGVIYDPKRHVVFSFGGDDGTVSIVAVRSRKDIALVQTLKTQPSGRLGALDPTTGRVYVPVAIFGPPAKPMSLPGLGSLPGLNPSTFKFIVIAPTTP